MANEKSVMAVIRAARPKFRNSADKIVFALHSIFLADGFQLNATGTPAFAVDALTASYSDVDDVPVDGWNEVEGNYAFVYTNTEKGAKRVLVKCIVMNNKLLLDALAADSSEPVHLEINIDDFVGESEGTNYGSQFKNLDKLIDSVNEEVLGKLYGSSSATTSTKGSSSQQKEPTDDRDQQSYPSGYVPQHPGSPYPSGEVVPPVFPGTGGGDLYPGPAPGVYPARGGFGDGGMLVGPNDPIFFGGMGGGATGFPGGQPGVPPGARFDPYGPPNVPGFEPSRFTRNPRRPPGGGTHPDLEHFGSGSDFI